MHEKRNRQSVNKHCRISFGVVAVEEWITREAVAVVEEEAPIYNEMLT